MTPTASGARLHCVFQRLQGEASREGLWLTSTVPDQPHDHFCVMAAVVGRWGAEDRTSRIQHRIFNIRLKAAGSVRSDGQTVWFSRPRLVEEYSVSMGGVRQDFIVSERPGGVGQLCVALAVTGASVEPRADGARLVLTQYGRKIAYSRLKVTDANGKQLPARIEVASNSALRTCHGHSGAGRGRDLPRAH